MPKPIINNNQKMQQKFSPDLALQERNTFKSPELAFREKRPQNYIDLITNLDIEYSNVSQDKLNKLLNQLKNNVPYVACDDTFLGVLGKCELGPDYDVHILSKKIIFGIDEATHQPGFGRMILKHFKIGESLPAELEKGRSLAQNPNYAFVEVYNDKLIAVQNDGTVAIIKD